MGIRLKGVAQNTAAIIIDGQVFWLEKYFLFLIHFFRVWHVSSWKNFAFEILTFNQFFCYFQDESSYVLKDTLTTVNLIDFVYNYTSNKLTRHLRHDSNAKHSHFYRSVNSQNDENYHPNVDDRFSPKKFDFIEMPILSSENFTDFISEPSRVSCTQLTVDFIDFFI